MNLKIDLTEKNQQLLQELGIKIEDKAYSRDEIKSFTNKIGEYIFSQSTKNGDLSKATEKYNDVLNVFVKNEK